MGTKSSDGTTTGYRYSFSILSGICRGPVDQLFLLRADGKVFYDLPTTENATLTINAADLFGGDKGQGGLLGYLEVYFGRSDQVISFTSLIRRIMVGLRVPQMRGVLTAFYTGQVCSNDPYPKAWQFRVRRAVKGWHNDDCWYPEKALIVLSDPSVPSYAAGRFNLYNSATSTTMVDSDGNPTSDPSAAVTTAVSTYQSVSVTTYSTTTGTTTTYTVPQFYNEIHAMNPAHMIYECATNPDWGRGLAPELIDNVSFTSCANKLYTEGLGLCMKWSQAEDIDVFVQGIIDHIGAAVYTDPISGLLSMRLVRDDYTVSSLPVFDYEHGLLEVTSVQTAATDSVPSEVIVQYHSPVLDKDREVRQQNAAVINSQNSFFPLRKTYAGFPTSTLAMLAAVRELKVNSGGWKRVEFKVDRRGYNIVPADVFRLTAPDKGITDLVVRVATIDHTAVQDGYISIVATQDVYGWPQHPFSAPAPYTFQDVNRYPMPPLVQNISIATYRDVVKYLNVGLLAEQSLGEPLPASGDFGIGKSYITVQAQRPSSVSIAYAAYVRRTTVNTTWYDTDLTHDWRVTNYLNFQNLSRLSNAIGVGDTTFQISGDVLPSNALIGGCYMLCDSSFSFFTTGNEEFVRLDAISQNPTTGVVTVTVARGCVDTPAIPHVKGSRLWAYDEGGGAVNEAFGYFDNAFVKCLTHTVSRGDLDPSRAPQMSIIPDARQYKVYCGAGFKVNGYVRDQVPPQDGDLVCTWHHRNRVTIAEHLIGEDEADVAPAETGTVYGITVFATFGGPVTDSMVLTAYEIPFGYTGGWPFAVGTHSNTMTITRADLIAGGVLTGPMRLAFYTGRGTPSPEGLTNFWSAANHVFSDFQYIVDPVVPDTDTSGGFNFDFGYNFGGG